MKVLIGGKEAEVKAYARAGAIADETLSSIRTVTSFNGQRKAVKQYNCELEKAENIGIKVGRNMGINSGLTLLIMYSIYSVGLWYAAQLVARSREERAECSIRYDLDGSLLEPADDCLTGGKVISGNFSFFL